MQSLVANLELRLDPAASGDHYNRICAICARVRRWEGN